MFNKMIIRLLFVCCLALIGGSVSAAPIQFSFWGTGTGTLGQSSFTNAGFTLDMFADTNNITGSSTKTLVGNSATFSVSGVGTGLFTENLQMFGNSVGTGISRASSGFDLIDFLGTPGLKSYNLSTATAVFTENSPCCASQFSSIATDLGGLSFTSFGDVSFQATDPNAPNNNNVPEPAPLALLGFGLLGIGFLRKRRG